MAVIPDAYLDLLTQKTTFAHLATVMPDGSPQVTPIWFDYTNGIIRVNTAKGRVKQRNMKEGSPVALAIMDPYVDGPLLASVFSALIRSLASICPACGALAHERWPRWFPRHEFLTVKRPISRATGSIGVSRVMDH